VLAMLNAGHDVPLRRAVASELISDHDAWRWHLLLQQPAQHSLGGNYALDVPTKSRYVNSNLEARADYKPYRPDLQRRGRRKSAFREDPLARRSGLPALWSL
jgi:hypothetical protein